MVRLSRSWSTGRHAWRWITAVFPSTRSAGTLIRPDGPPSPGGRRMSDNKGEPGAAGFFTATVSRPDAVLGTSGCLHDVAAGDRSEGRSSRTQAAEAAARGGTASQHPRQESAGRHARRAAMRSFRLDSLDPETAMSSYLPCRFLAPSFRPRCPRPRHCRRGTDRVAPGAFPAISPAPAITCSAACRRPAGTRLQGGLETARQRRLPRRLGQQRKLAVRPVQRGRARVTAWKWMPTPAGAAASATR